MTFARAAPLIPYLAMLVGLHILGSAWLSFLIYHGLVLVAVGRRPALWRDLSRGGHFPTGVAAMVFGSLGGVVLWLLAPIAGVDAQSITPALQKLGLSGTSWLLFVFYHALINPWFEEILWRGKLGSDARTLVAGDVLFAGYHVLVLMLFLAWTWIALAFAMLVSAAWFWRQLRRRHDGLLLPVLSHLAADASIMSVVYLLSLSR